MQLKVKRKIEQAIFMISLGITLAGCQAPTEKATQNTDKMTMPHTNTAKADKTVPPTTQPSNTESPAKGEVQIVIENFVFKPADVTVAPGTKVTWINKDEAPHTATSTDKKFNSGGLDTNDTFSFVFNDKGDYPYFCTLHPQMKAQIKVN